MRPTDLEPVAFDDVRLGQYYYSRIDSEYGQLVGMHYEDGAAGFLEIYDLEDGDCTDKYVLVDLSCLYENSTTARLNRGEHEHG